MAIFTDNRPLLDAYRRGERQALAAIYDAYAPLIVDVLRHGFEFQSQGRSMRFRGFADPLEFETFVQEVFLRAFSDSARRGYDGLRPFEPYLLRLARNRVIDALRQRRTALERLVGPLDESDAHVSVDPQLDERLDAARGKRLVREYVASLGELERAYVEARFVTDLSLLAAARQLGITRMRARVIERRVLRDLHRHLRRAGFLEAGEVVSSLATVLV